MDISIDRNFLVEQLAALVRIDSVNPDLVPGAAGESEIAAYLAGVLRELGLDVHTQEPKPGRTSVIGVRKGRGGGKSLLLTGHTDTVGVEGMGEPFTPRVQDGRLYGRGAFDMKCGLAACLGALKALQDTRVDLPGDVWFAGVADEEYGSLGSEAFIREHRVDGVVIAEPSGLTICRVHKGFIWFEVETRGKAAHGSDFAGGVDAILYMGRFLAELEKLALSQQNGPAHDVLGPPSLHASVIDGGVEWSTYPPGCTLKIEWRTVPGQTAESLTQTLQDNLDRLAAADPAFQASLKTILVREPFEISPQAELVQVISRNTRAVTGAEPSLSSMAGWGDTALFASAGMPALIFGPGGAGAHAQEEWADLASLEQAARILAKTAIDYCSVGVGSACTPGGF